LNIFSYEAAGDQYVGRVVSGLPLLSPEFAILPPHFSRRDDVVQHAIQVCFPDITPQKPNMQKMVRVAEMCLASVVYHSEFLIQTLPSTHVLFESTLFREQEMLSELQQRVLCRIAVPSDTIQPTGFSLCIYL
jgi:hypothetical protein